MAIKVFVKELHLENEDLLHGKVQVHEILTNTYIMQDDFYKVKFMLIFSSN